MTRRRDSTVALLVAASALSIAAAATAQAPVSAAIPRNGVTPPSTVTAVIATIPVGAGPEGVALSNDDTVYVTNYNSDPTTMSVIDGATNMVVDTVPVLNRPLGVAVGVDDSVYVVNDYVSRLTVLNGRDLDDSYTIPLPYKPLQVAVSNDDTVYITNVDDSAVTIVNGRRGIVDDTVQVAQGPYGIAVNKDDTVYTANSWPIPRLTTINGRDGTVANITAVGNGPIGVAVSRDDTVYVANRFAGALTLLRGSALDDSRTISMVDPMAVATTDQDIVYVTLYSNQPNNVYVVDGKTGTLIETVSVGRTPLAVGVSSRLQTAYVANKDDSTVSVLTQVSPAISASSAVPGTPLTLQVNFPGDDTVLMDDSTVQSISFGGTPAVGWTRDFGLNSWSGPMPSAAVGTSLAVTVAFKGGKTASAGSVTVVDPPAPPTPSLPPSPPLSVRATAGDASVSVSWSAPGSSGSFPVTYYEVSSMPTGGSCLSRETSCEITGLRNGTTYTFTARALNGAGWSASSAASDAVTPRAPARPSIVITGMRADVGGVTGVRISGVSTGLPVGTVLRAWVRFPGQAAYTQGARTIAVLPDGSFGWERRTARKTFVYVAHESGSVKSNTLTIPRASP